MCGKLILLKIKIVSENTSLLKSPTGHLVITQDLIA
jgi:hypothetical protein